LEKKSHKALSKFSIKEVETITGIKAHTLRVWEQRYGLIKPKRTETNIRYYTDGDLRFILNVSILNNYGIKISEIAKMEYEKIQEMVLAVSEKSSPCSHQIQALVAAMYSLDESAFNRILSTNILKSGLESTMCQVVFPFMHQIGILWLTGSVHPAHEHFISNLVRQKLFVAIDAQDDKLAADPKRFLLFLPEGEPHEIGLLFANYIIRSYGHEVIYLGQNQPFDDLQEVFNFYRPHFVLSALTSAFAEEDVQYFINRLSQNWPEATILLTGFQIVENQNLHLPPNVEVLKELGSLRTVIQAIPFTEKA